MKTSKILRSCWSSDRQTSETCIYAIRWNQDGRAGLYNLRLSVSDKLHKIFTKYHKTHNQGVFDIYTPEMKKARHNKIITGLPDTYGRGRIVGDYRRVALYGIDFSDRRKNSMTLSVMQVTE